MAARTAFSACERPRMVVPITWARASMRSNIRSGAVVPACTPTTRTLPRLRSKATRSRQSSPPTSSTITSYGACAASWSGVTTSTRPSGTSPVTRSWSSGRRTLATTCAPDTAATWTMAVPTPPAAPVINTRSPARTPTWVTRPSQAVLNASGKPAASSHDSPSGTARRRSAGTVIRSAWPPPPTNAITRSPGATPTTPGPTCSTSPATSRPGTSAGHPGGAG